MKSLGLATLGALGVLAGIELVPLAWGADAPTRYEASCEFVRARPVGGYLQICRLKDVSTGLCYMTVGDAGVTPIKCD